MSAHILIYTPRTSNRLIYTLQLITSAFPGTSTSATSDQEKYKNSSALKINYSHSPVDRHELRIPPEELLFQTSVQPASTSYLENMRRAIDTYPPEGDLLSFMFYMVSRYEEYNLPDERLDAHGRFPASQSQAAKWGILRRPVVDEWIDWIGRSLESLYPCLRLKRRQYQFLPTYDIDSAWRFLHKGFWRNGAGGANDLLQGEIARLKSRIKTLAGQAPDPDHTFELIADLSACYALSPIFFWLLSNVRRPYDTNIPVDRPAFRALVGDVAAKNLVGIHPSYRSNGDPAVLKKEIDRLKRLLPASPAGATLRSRQHFLKLRFPETYRRLVEAGVREDYSMGFADDLGFRAGTASPFLWYDLEREEKTSLLVFPFQVMDATLQKYLALSPEEAVRQTELIIASIKSAGGIFCSLWHNSSLSDQGEWKGWRQVYEKIIQLAVEKL